MTVGTLLLGERVEGTKHARFRYTCIGCGATGERDARNILRGCPTCKFQASVEGTDKRVSVVTPLEIFEVTPLQMLMALRKHPGAETRFYFEGKRVKVIEDEEYVHVSQPAQSGEPVRLSYPKLEQQLEDGYSWTLPAQMAENRTEITQEPVDPFALHHELPKPKPAPEPYIEPPKAEFVVPDGWLKLERPSDAVWLGEDYPAGLPPPYLQTWFDLYPEGTYRVAPADGDLYAVCTPKQAKPAMSFLSDEELEEVEAEAELARERAVAEREAHTAEIEAAMLPERLKAHLMRKAYTAEANASRIGEGPMYDRNDAAEIALYRANLLVLEDKRLEVVAAENAADLAEDLACRPVQKPYDPNAETPEQRMIRQLQTHQD